MNDAARTQFWSRLSCCFHRVGIIGLCLCAITAAIAGYSFASGDIMAAMGFSVIGCTVSGLSVLCFIVSGLPEGLRRRRHVACVVLVLLLPVLVQVVGITLGNRRYYRNIERTRNAMANVISSIEAIRARTGQVPRDERELVDRLGKALPSLPAGTTFQYQRNSSDPQHYCIWCVIGGGFGGDVLEYDSRYASQGIVRSF